MGMWRHIDCTSSGVTGRPVARKGAGERMHRFLSTWKTDLVSRVPLVLWAVLTVIVSLAGPFGTLEELRLFQRMLFWAIVIGATLFIGTGCRAFVQSVLGLTDFVRGVPMIAFLVSSSRFI